MHVGLGGLERNGIIRHDLSDDLIFSEPLLYKIEYS